MRTYKKIGIPIMVMFLFACGASETSEEGLGQKNVVGDASTLNAAVYSNSEEQEQLKIELNDKYGITEPSHFAQDSTGGKWKITTTTTIGPTAEYALDFANAYMTDGDTDFIVNLTLKETTMLLREGNMLHLKATEYVDKEENDSSLIGQGACYTKVTYDLSTGEEYSN